MTTDPEVAGDGATPRASPPAGGRVLDRWRVAFALLLAWFAPLAATFVAAPIVVREVGAEEFGLFALVNGTVVSVAAIGMSRAVAVSVASRSHASTRRSLRWSVGLAAIGAVAVGAVAGFAPLDWLTGDAVTESHARAALAAGALGVVGTALLSGASGLAIGRTRYGSVGLVSSALGVLTSVGYVVIVLAGGDAVGMLLWHAAVTTAGAAVYWLLHARADPAGDGDRAARATTLAVAPFVVAQLAGNTAVVVERVGLAATTGLDAVTEFVIPQMLVLALHGALVWLTTPVLVSAADHISTGRDRELDDLYVRTSRAVAVGAGLGAAVLAVLGRDVLDALLDGEAVISPANFALLTVYALGMSLTVVPWSVAEAGGAADLTARVGTVWLAIVIAGAVLTTWGEVTAAAAARAAMVVTLPPFLLAVERRLGLSTPWNVHWAARWLGSTCAAAGGAWIVWVAADRHLVAAIPAAAFAALVMLVAGPPELRRLVLPGSTR